MLAPTWARLTSCTWSADSVARLCTRPRTGQMSAHLCTAPGYPRSSVQTGSDIDIWLEYPRSGTRHLGVLPTEVGYAATRDRMILE